MEIGVEAAAWTMESSRDAPAGTGDDPPLGDLAPMTDDEVLEFVRSNWGSKTLEAFRLESERQPKGGLFEAARNSEGRRVLILLCATRPEDVSRFVTMFTLVDDGVGEDWATTTLLDLVMGSKRISGVGFSCLRDKDGKRRALIFIAHDPRSISKVERLFGLPP